jgi:hypothetical protein
MLEKGKFTISIDHESALGYADYDLSDSDKKRIEGEIFIVRRLISLFEQYNIPATWGVVGHLIDRGCPWDAETPHPEYKRPVHEGEEKDWFREHPPKNEYENPLWFDTENLISMVRSSPVGHDIGSHSYAHIMYDEEKTNIESIKADLKNIGRVHRVHDVPLTSFIFPRNIGGYYRYLKLNGFTTYRGVSPKWYEDKKGWKKRLSHFIDYMLPTGRTSTPDIENFGLVNIPDSMLLIGRNGPRGLLTPKIMVRKAKIGLKMAIRKKEVFHLWFHPSNFSYDTEDQFDIFEEILKEASRLRDEGKLEIQTMEDIANEVLKVGGKNESDNS